MPSIPPASRSRRFWRGALLVVGASWLLITSVSAIGGLANRSFTAIYFLPILVVAPLSVAMIVGAAYLHRSRTRRRRILLALVLGVAAAAVAALLAYVLTLW